MGNCVKLLLAPVLLVSEIFVGAVLAQEASTASVVPEAASVAEISLADGQGESDRGESFQRIIDLLEQEIASIEEETAAVRADRDREMSRLEEAQNALGEMESRLSALRNETADAEARLAELQSQSVTLSEEATAKKAALETALTEAEATLASLSDKRATLEERITQHEALIEQMAIETDAAKKELGDARSGRDAALATQAETENAAEAAATRLSALDEQVNGGVAELAELASKLERTRADIRDSETTRETALAKQSEAEAELAAAQERLATVLAEAEAKTRAEEGKLAKLNEEVAAQDARLAEITALFDRVTAEVKEAESAHASALSSKEGAEAALSAIQEKLSASEDLAAAADAREAEMLQQQDEAQKVLEDLRTEIAEIRTRLGDMSLRQARKQNEIQELGAEEQSIRATLESGKSELEQLNVEIEALLAARTEAQKPVADLAAIENEIEARKAELALIERRQADLSTEASKLDNEIAAKKVAFDGVTEQLDVSSKALIEVMQATVEAKGESAAMAKEVAKADAARTAAESERAAMAVELDNMRSEQSELLAKLEEARTSRSEAEAEAQRIETAKAEMVTLAKQKTELDVELAGLEEDRIERARLVQQLDEKIALAEARLSALESEPLLVSTARSVDGSEAAEVTVGTSVATVPQSRAPSVVAAALDAAPGLPLPGTPERERLQNLLIDGECTIEALRLSVGTINRQSLLSLVRSLGGC